jgi:FkbM family methyltransferase
MMHETSIKAETLNLRKDIMTSVKQYVLPALRRKGIYQRLRTSAAFDVYRRLLKKGQVEDRDREIRFYQTLLEGFRPGDVVFDVGANVGTKTEVFLSIGARVVAVEPDECNQGVLRSKFLRYRLKSKPVTIVGLAVSELEGVETMWIDGAGSALNTLSEKWVDALRDDKKRFEHTDDPLEFGQKKRVETTTLERLIAVHGSPFFVKIDVEGNELRVLRGLHDAVPYLSFEVNLPEFRQEGIQCVNVLRDLAGNGQFNYSTDCRSGLALGTWLEAEEFVAVLDSCRESCIEVFWRTRVSLPASSIGME